MQTCKKRVSVLLLTLSLLFTACAAPTPYSRYQIIYIDCLDTVCVIDVYLHEDQDPDFIKDAIHEELLRYHRLFDAYHSYDGVTNIHTVNERAGAGPVTVPQELLSLLIFCLEEGARIDYRTNLAFGRVTRIWKDFFNDVSDGGMEGREFASGELSLPPQDILAAAGMHTDPARILIDTEASSVSLSDPDMLLDVGAVAKGYIAEKLSDFIRDLGVESACLNLGGNIKVVGERKDTDGRRYWTAAVKDPVTLEPLSVVLKLTDGMTVVTSGNYERYVQIDGTRYCHLIDPDTLYPVQGMASVTVVAKDSGLADYLSTALFTVDVERGQEILSLYPDAEALWITSDYEIYRTEGFDSCLVP